MACVKVNDNITQWFDISSGVRQGDSLSPTLFGLFINDLISEVKTLNLGVNINDIIISILAFAGDIVIIAQNEKELQDILHCVWRLKINVNKTNVVHFSGKHTKPTDYNFLFDNNVLKIVDKYNYLGIILQEHLDFNVTASVLASTAGRALRAIISKFKSFKNAGFNTFSKMYNSHAIPIMDYSSGNMGIFKI